MGIRNQLSYHESGLETVNEGEEYDEEGLDNSEKPLAIGKSRSVGFSVEKSVDDGIECGDNGGAENGSIDADRADRVPIPDSPTAPERGHSAPAIMEEPVNMADRIMARDEEEDEMLAEYQNHYFVGGPRNPKDSPKRASFQGESRRRSTSSSFLGGATQLPFGKRRSSQAPVAGKRSSLSAQKRRSMSMQQRRQSEIMRRQSEIMRRQSGV